jgi:membrane fusion protein, multidrug efflux system
VVTAVGAQVGQVVAAAQMVVRVARTDAKEAEFRVAERTLRSVPRDSVVEVSLLSNPNIKALGPFARLPPPQIRPPGLSPSGSTSKVPPSP